MLISYCYSMKSSQHNSSASVVYVESIKFLL